jgi:hypothetical protein
MIIAHFVDTLFKGARLIFGDSGLVIVSAFRSQSVSAKYINVLTFALCFAILFSAAQRFSPFNGYDKKVI